MFTQLNPPLPPEVTGNGPGYAISDGEQVDRPMRLEECA